MIATFFILSILFIWNEFYYLKNRTNLDIRFRDRDIDGTTKLDVFYYLTCPLLWIWLFIGYVWLGSNIFMTIIILKLFKFIIFHINRNIFSIYNNKILPILSISLFVYILTNYTLNLFK
jgi:hypothetical protein